MKRKPKNAESLYSAYLAAFGDTLPNLNGNKPLKLTKQRFAGLYNFNTWRDFKDLIESNELGNIAEHVSRLDTDIKRHTTPLIIDILLKERVEVGEVLTILVKLGTLTFDDVEHFINHDGKCISKNLQNVLCDLFKTYDPATSFELRIPECKFIFDHMWESTSFKSRLTVFQLLCMEGSEFPIDKLTGLWEEANSLLSDRTSTPHWGNFSHTNKEAVRRLTGAAVQHTLVTIDELMKLYDNKPKVSAELELQMLSSSSYLKGLFGDPRQHITLTDALLWLFKGNGLAEEDIEVLRFYDKFCCLSKLNDKLEPLVEIESILTSTSLITEPVLATYLLNNLGRNDFTIERLFAVFYRLKSAVNFNPLIIELQSVAKVDLRHSYRKEDFESELIAAILLTRNATNIRKFSREQFENYLDVLSSILDAKHYVLVFKECSRFIELSNLESVPAEFEFAFNETLEKITDQQFNSLSTQDIKGAYLLAKRMGIASERLTARVSEDTKSLGEIFDNDAAMDVLKIRNEARRKKLEVIYCAVDAFGYNYNTKSGSGQFHLGTHREPLVSHLFDALALSGAYAPDQIKVNKAISPELAPLIDEAESSHVIGNHRGSQLHRIGNIDELVGYPEVLTEFHKKLSKSVGSSLLYSKEVLIILHAEGFVPDDVVQCGRSYFVTLRDGVMTVFGEVNSQDQIFALLDEFRPNTVTNVSVYSIAINSVFRDDYPHGSLIIEQKSISFQPVTKWKKDILELIRDTFQKIDVGQYYGRNPMADVARRMSPVFECCGTVFNPTGTDYSTIHQTGKPSLHIKPSVADPNTIPTSIAS